jgi:Flp pilus assembly protein TadG
MFGIPAATPTIVTSAGGESLPRESLPGDGMISDRRKNERGSVTIMTAVLLVGLVLVIGLSIDVSRIYMVRSGLQNAADAAALAAARELNGGTGGLTDAVAQAKAAALEANKYGLNRTGATVSKVSVAKVEFSTSLAPNATWYDNTNGNAVPAGVETSIKYVRVTTQTASVTMLFTARALGANHVEQRTAVAGASVGLNRVCNFFPIAVALTNPHPANHAALTFTFTDGGSSVTLVNFGYTTLQVSDIPGVGVPETVKLAAGVTKDCASLGSFLKASPSANGSNGPKAVADGANSRFDDRKNLANNLSATDYPPDTNIYDPLTAVQYLNKSPFLAPASPGQDDRRVLIMPIVPPGTYVSDQVPLTRWGAFLLTKKVNRGVGSLEVQYLGDDFIISHGFYDPTAPVDPTSTLNIPVLYR